MRVLSLNRISGAVFVFKSGDRAAEPLICRHRQRLHRHAGMALGVEFRHFLIILRPSSPLSCQIMISWLRAADAKVRPNIRLANAPARSSSVTSLSLAPSSEQRSVRRSTDHPVPIFPRQRKSGRFWNLLGAWYPRSRSSCDEIRFACFLSISSRRSPARKSSGRFCVLFS